MRGKSNFFGEQLKKIMLEKNISQKELADKLDVAQQMISFWVTGSRNPTLTSIKKIAEALDIPMTYLLDENQNNKENKNADKNDKIDTAVIMKLIEENNKRLELELALLKKDNENIKNKMNFLEEEIKNFKTK